MKNFSAPALWSCSSAWTSVTPFEPPPSKWEWLIPKPDDSLKQPKKNLECKLLNSTTGGKGGGGAELTQECRAFMEKYLHFEAKVRAYSEKAFAHVFQNETT
ncbi:hypothetical protein [Eubacterium aggregans]|uniref:hypothetical protein n=1 Tax=Eubacterium aggregans TaxID=81409 RepID=UPI003F31FD2F